MCERRRQLEEAVTRLAMLSLHTSPLVQPGGGDAGGMNVYVRELVAALAHGGADTTVYVRRWRDDLPKRLAVEPGFEVVHIDAGDPTSRRSSCPASSTSSLTGCAPISRSIRPTCCTPTTG